MTEIHFVCKLDKKIYSVVTTDIQSDEVIVTEERLAHIRERHLEDYDFFVKYGTEVILRPDYILEAGRPSSAMLLKEIDVNRGSLKLILRLKTSADPDDFKNSVITFQKVSPKRFSRYLSNGKILYKRK